MSVNNLDVQHVQASVFELNGKGLKAGEHKVGMIPAGAIILGLWGGIDTVFDGSCQLSVGDEEDVAKHIALYSLATASRGWAPLLKDGAVHPGGSLVIGVKGTNITKGHATYVVQWVVPGRSNATMG